MNLRWTVLLGVLAASAWLVFTDRPSGSPRDVVADMPRRAAPSSTQSTLSTQREAAPLPSSFVAVLTHRAGEGSPATAPAMLADPFAVRDWAPVTRPAAPVASAPAAPTVPANPFSYLGKQRSDMGWQVFLARGEQTLIVREGSMVDGDTYRVDSIKPPVLTLTYMPMAATQTISIGGEE